MALAEDLDRVVRAAGAHAGSARRVSAILATEPDPGLRVYLCALDGADGFRSWIALDGAGDPVTSRTLVRSAVSIAALCEVAAEAAGGGDLEALIARLEELHTLENVPGIGAAIQAARELRAVLGEPPQVATPARLDAIGVATRRLEQELDPTGASPFGAAMQAAQASVAELQREIEAGYLVELT